MMMIKRIISSDMFLPVYYPYLQDYTHPIEVYYGSAGSGKSRFICQKIVIKAAQSKRFILVTRKTFASIEKTIFKEFKTVLNSFKLPYKERLSPFALFLPNGSEIHFVGIDNPEKLKSYTVDDVLLEEATLFDKADYSQLTLRLRGNAQNKQMYLLYNPTSPQSWVYQEFHKDTTDPRILRVFSTYKDNRFLDETTVNNYEAQQYSDPLSYRRNVLGEWVSAEGQIYKGNWRVDTIDSSINLPEFAGLDFGDEDPTAFICGKIDTKNKIIYIQDEFYFKHLTFQQIIDNVTLKGFKDKTIYADNQASQIIKELFRRGLTRIHPCHKTKIVEGIQILKNYYFIVNPSCTNTIMELNNYRWESNDDMSYSEKPVDEYNHLMDALRYATLSATSTGTATVHSYNDIFGRK